MIFGERCPHCNEETEVEEPAGPDCYGGDVVELQTEYGKCGRPFVAIFKVRYWLTEVRAG